jgi:hypothetical protein
VADAPGSPRAGRLATPGWLDGRLVLGVLLVLVSVVVGARVLSAADQRQTVWTADRDLAAGTALSVDDVRPAQVRLFGTAGEYLPAPDDSFVGYVLDRPLSAGELVPVDALLRPGEDVDVRYVSVPVLPGRYPDGLRKGQQVDVWATPDQDAAAAQGATAAATPAPTPGAAAAGASRLVLEALTVHDAPDAGGALAGSAERSVVLSVAPEDVATLVGAMAAGRIDLVRVPGPGDTRAELARLTPEDAAR